MNKETPPAIVNFHEFNELPNPLSTPSGEKPPTHVLALVPIISTIKAIFPWVNPYLDGQVNTTTSGFTIFLSPFHKVNGLLLDVGNLSHRCRNKSVHEILSDEEFRYSIFFDCGLKKHKYQLSSQQEDLVGGVSKIMNLMMDSTVDNLNVSFKPFFYTQDILPECMHGGGYRIPSGQPFWMNPNLTGVRMTKFSFDGRKRPTDTWFWLKKKDTFVDNNGHIYEPIPYHGRLPLLKTGFIPEELA